MGFTGTPAAEYCEQQVLARFDDEIIGIGQYNRRPIAGTKVWSQHSWGNALDLHVSVGRADAVEKANGDRIAKWLRSNKTALGVKAVIWWTTSHYDHIHVDFWPKGHSTPPKSTTGVGYFKYSNGVVKRSSIQTIPMQGKGLGEHEMAVMQVEDVQEALNAAGHKGANGKKLTVDGIYGPNTKHALVAAYRSGGSTGGLTKADVKAIVNDAEIVAQ